MGLAASQARFLAITARKGNCETRSMEIAQEKLSLTRQLAQASEEYEEALDATRLVWDGDTGTVYDLSYDIMMSPSELNGYSPYLITSRTGQIVLSNQLATAAEAAGLDPVYTQGSLDGRNAFVQALADVGYISGSTAAAIIGDDENPTVEWSASAGFGGYPLDKSQASAMTLSTMVNYMENVLDPDYRNQFDQSSQQYTNYEALANALTLTNPSNSKLFVNDNEYTDSQFTVADLLTDDVTLIMDIADDTLVKELTTFLKEDFDDYILNGGQLSSSSTNTYSAATVDLLNSIHGIYNAFSTMLADDTQQQDTQALEFALKQTIQQIIDNTISGNYKKESKLLDAADDQNGAVYSKKKKETAISLSNIAEMFLTNYAIALDGYSSGYYIGSTSATSNYVTDDYNYMYVLANQESVYDEKDLMIADFINVLYNNICQYGWTTCEGGDITDNSFLQSCLKNGTYFISSLNTDNYYYQDHYTKNGCVGEITDDDAITQAEAKYNTMKTKLNYKEETLELELKNLDLEISSLTTEYDTVKSMISKNVEKIFTLFSS